MYKPYTGTHETMKVNTIAYYKDGDAYIRVAVVDYIEETGEYVMIPFEDKIGVSGEFRTYHSKTVYFKETEA